MVILNDLAAPIHFHFDHSRDGKQIHREIIP